MDPQQTDKADQTDPLVGQQPEQLNDGPILAEPAERHDHTADTTYPEDPDEDLGVDEVVDDIVSSESDELLAAHDAASQPIAVAAKPSMLTRIKGGIEAWWHNKRLRNLTFAVFGVLLVAILSIPVTRYAVLNTVGVRASTTINVIDSASGQPIRNVDVTVANVSGKTDADGKVTLGGVRLGHTTIELKKRSFETLQTQTTIGWGSNIYLDPFSMKATGTEFAYTIVSWINGKPIVGAKITAGDSTAVADDKGVARLVIEPTDEDFKATISADGFRSEQVTILSSDTSGKRQELVPDRPDVFVSNRDGRYDLYRRDLDGKNEAILFAGTGKERADMSLLVQPTADKAAFVSTREGRKNRDGYLLGNLYIVDVRNKTVTKVEGTESEDIALHAWVGDRLIVTKTVAGASAGNDKRMRVMSIDTVSNKPTELAAANYFHDVKVMGGNVYMAVGSGGVPGGPAAVNLVRKAADGSGRTVLVNQEIYSMYRVARDQLLATGPDNKWFSGTLTAQTLAPQRDTPANPIHRAYAKAPNSDTYAWLDERDGRGVLLVTTPDGKDQQIVARGGLMYPLRWVSDDQVLVTVRTSQETANYIVDIPKKEFKKIGDITATRSVQGWYY